MVSLAEILSSTRRDLYSVLAEQENKDAGNDTFRLMLAKARPIQVRLRKWYANRPIRLGIEDVEV